MEIEIRSPKTEKEFEDYYQLRWEILRKPANEPRGSEKDKLEDSAFHMAAFDGDKIIGCGRLHLNNPDEAKLRFMAVDEKHQKQGIGGKILEELENIAQKKGVEYIILDARETAVSFYKKHGFKTYESGPVVIIDIPHWRMKKVLVSD